MKFDDEERVIVYTHPERGPLILEEKHVRKPTDPDDGIRIVPRGPIFAAGTIRAVLAACELMKVGESHED